ncbi:MAG: adenosine deaminase [Clostridia bacterium]|nr:adenosine deaminase [Clostridia bacterium]
MIDLHLHLDGSLPVETVLKLAKMQDITLPTNDINELKYKYLMVNEDCKDLTEYLERFDFPLKLMQTKESLIVSVSDLLTELKNQGLVYAEIRFAPQLHLQKGLTQREVIESAIEGLKKVDLKANLILCCMRGKGNESLNEETVKLAKEYLGKGVCAVDLAGAEAIFTTDKFTDLFALVNYLELPYTLHAGEADGAKSVELALDYGASRIGHGVRSVEDDDVVNRLINEKIAIEVCPKSNFDTNTFKDMLKDYPVKRLLDKGVLVTINTDNMTVSDTTLKNEYRILKENFGFTDEDIKKVLLNSANVAFVSSEEREEIKKMLKERF